MLMEQPGTQKSCMHDIAGSFPAAYDGFADPAIGQDNIEHVVSAWGGTGI